MSGGILLALALLVKLFQTYYTKKTSLALSGGGEIVAFTAWRYLLCVVLAFLLLLFEGGASVSPMALAISALGGISLALCGVFEYRALQHGAVVLMQLAAMSGLLIPCIVGIWLFHEPFTLRNLFGVLLLGFAAFLLMGYQNSRAGKPSPKLWVCLLVVLLSNGLTMLSQKLYSVWLPEEPVSLYSLLCFAVASGVLWCILPGIKEKQQGSTLLKKTVLPALCILAAAVFLINQMVTAASALLPAVVLFPAFNGLGLVLSTLLSALCFKERLTPRSILGMLLGITALLLFQ